MEKKQKKVSWLWGLVPVLVAAGLFYMYTFLQNEIEIADIIPINKQYVLVFEKVEDPYYKYHPFSRREFLRLKKIDIINNKEDTISLPLFSTSGNGPFFHPLRSLTSNSLINDLLSSQRHFTLQGNIFTCVMYKNIVDSTNDRDKLTHFSVDLQNNRALWRSPIVCGDYQSLKLFYDDTTVYRTYYEGKLKNIVEAINPESGTILWKKEIKISGTIENLLVFDDHLVLYNRYRNYVILDKKRNIYQLDNSDDRVSIAFLPDAFYWESMNKLYTVTTINEYSFQEKKKNELFKFERRFLGQLFAAYRENLIYIYPGIYNSDSEMQSLVSYNLKDFSENWELHLSDNPGFGLIDDITFRKHYSIINEQQPFFPIRSRYMPVIVKAGAQWTDNLAFSQMMYGIIDMESGTYLFRSKPIEMNFPSLHEQIYTYNGGKYYFIVPQKGEGKVSFVVFDPSDIKDSGDSAVPSELVSTLFPFSFQLWYKDKENLKEYAIFPTDDIFLKKYINNDLIYLFWNDQLYVVSIPDQKVIYGNPEELYVKDTRPEVYTNLLEGLSNNVVKIDPLEVDNMLQEGRDINILVSGAVNNNDFEGLELLLEKGADINGEGFSPLMRAIYNEQKEMALFLLEHGANVNQKAQMGYTAMNYTIINSDTELAEILLKHGADPNSKLTEDRLARVPLLIQAVASYNTDMVKLLLQYGADPMLTDNEGNTALDYARIREHKNMIELLTQ